MCVLVALQRTDLVHLLPPLQTGKRQLLPSLLVALFQPPLPRLSDKGSQLRKLGKDSSPSVKVWQHQLNCHLPSVRACLPVRMSACPLACLSAFVCVCKTNLVGPRMGLAKSGRAQDEPEIRWTRLGPKCRRTPTNTKRASQRVPKCQKGSENVPPQRRTTILRGPGAQGPRSGQGRWAQGPQSGQGRE